MDRHIRPLDGLRGIAVAGVLMFHADSLPGGYLGVDLFFVLSGFLITSLLLKERRNTGTINLRKFWIRRARRLLPAVVGLLIFIAAFSTTFTSGFELQRLRGDSLATIFYVANWNAILSQRGYFDLFNAPSLLEHTWSLAIEEQFYLVWPLVTVGLLKVLKVRLEVFLGICLALAATSFGLMVLLYEPGTDASRVYMGTDTRASSILLGAAAATAMFRWGHATSAKVRLALEVAAWGSVAYLAIAWTHMTGTADITYRGGLFGCSLAAAIIIVAVTNPALGPLGQILSWRPFVFLGAISYGLYLWHWPVYVALDPGRTNLDGWWLTGLRVTVSLAIAVTSYYLLEQPIRNGVIGRVLAGKWAILSAPAAAAAVALLIVIVTVVAAPPPHSAVAAGSGDPSDPMVLFVGDSGAYELAQRFNELGPELHLRVDDQAEQGCRLDRGDGQVRTIVGHNDVVTGLGAECGENAKLLAQTSGASIAFFHLAGPASGEIKIDGEFRNPCDQVFQDRFEQRLRKLVADITSSGLELVIANSPDIGSSRYTKELRAKLTKYTHCTNDLIARVQKSMPKTFLVDLDSWVCPGGACRTEQGGVVLRTDDTHFLGAGGHIAARWLAPQIETHLPATR